MAKLLIIPSSLEDLNLDVDGFIIGIKGLSVNNNFYISIRRLEKIVTKLKQNKKEVFISLNKNMFNKDLLLLEEVLLKLDKLHIDGLLYYDISVLSIIDRLNLNIPLIWSQEHLTTNYLTCNYYEEKKVKGVYLSSEITLQEVEEITKKTKMVTILPIFGYLPMFNSKRHIVKNYLNTFNLKDNSKINYLEKGNNLYPILDNKEEVTVYSSHILNGLNEFLLLNVHYVTLNSFNIDEEKLKKVAYMFKTVNKENVSNYDAEINKMFNNIDKGFFYKETIYKVKK